jgi:hypothetical protein
MFYMGNSIRLPGAYSPSTQKIYFEVLKNFDKIIYLYISTIYVCSSSFTKTDTICGLCKKEKNYHVKSLTFSTEFCLFNTSRQVYFFMK